MQRTSRNTKIIRAAREKVYRALTDKKALEYWQTPYGMTGRIHSFDLSVGGGYEMSLFYLDTEATGKTSASEDRFTATFVELVSCEKVVQAIRFQSDKSEFSGEMIMEVLLEDTESNATAITIIFKNIPAGVDPEDNEAGTGQSLEQLEKYLEQLE